MAIVCEICDKTFSRVDGLKRHLGTVHATTAGSYVSDDESDNATNTSIAESDITVENDFILNVKSLSLICHVLLNAEIGSQRLSKDDLYNIIENADACETEYEDDDSLCGTGAVGRTSGSSGEKMDSKDELSYQQLDYLMSIVKAATRRVHILTKAAFLDIIDRMQ